MFSPKFVLKGNLQARTRSPLPRGRAGRAPGAPGGTRTERAPPMCTRVRARTELMHTAATRVLGCHTRFRLFRVF